MRVTYLTNEYPPHIYGGAGVHIDHLSRGMAELPGTEVDVVHFGEPGAKALQKGLDARGAPSIPGLPHQRPEHGKVMDTLGRNLHMVGLAEPSDIVHGHTWYSHLAGCIAKQLWQAKLVLTTHSLEPHRPWKAEQLGTGYNVSSWIERTAYQNADGVIAVSEQMRRDVRALYGVPDEKIAVIPNGIDPDEFSGHRNDDLLRSLGIDPDAGYVLFVGRITRQKGIAHLLEAAERLPRGTQLVLCAGAPDTPALAAEVEASVEQLRSAGGLRVVWIAEMLPRSQVARVYAGATVFCCPSVYEPFGIINLEAMASGVAVVASRVGGIPEVVVDGETGVLVDVHPDPDRGFAPREPERFARELGEALAALLADPERARAMGAAGRRRVEERFAWHAIAEQTHAFYERLVG